MVTIKHVATAAGTSAMTVSRVLRNHPRVAPATRAKVLLAAKKLGYHANPMVSAWMSHVAGSRKASYMPVLYYLSRSPAQKGRQEGLRFTVQRGYLEHAQRRAEELGYRLEVLLMDEHSEPRINKILKARNCQGILVGPAVLIPTQELALDWDCFSSVTVGYSLKSPDLHRVCLNHYEGMQSVLRGIATTGKKIGYITRNYSDERVRHLNVSSYLGFHYHHPELNLLEPWLVKNLDRRLFVRWFQKHQPDFLLYSDSIVLEWVFQIDSRPSGAQCKLIHLDENYALDPRVYGVLRSSSDLIGREAMELLANLIQANERGLPRNPRTTLVPTEFVLRENLPCPVSG